jgi:hypothetical protein
MLCSWSYDSENNLQNLVPLSCTRSGGGKIDTKSEAMAVYSFGCIVHLSALSLPADLKLFFYF